MDINIFICWFIKKTTLQIKLALFSFKLPFQDYFANSERQNLWVDVSELHKMI